LRAGGAGSWRGSLLLGGDACALDDGGPSREIALDKRGEFLGRAAHRVDAERREADFSNWNWLGSELGESWK